MDNEARAFGNLLAAVSTSPSGSSLAVDWYKKNPLYATQFSLENWLAHIAQHMAIFNNMTPPRHRIVPILNTDGLATDYRVLYVADAWR